MAAAVTVSFAHPSPEWPNAAAIAVLLFQPNHTTWAHLLRSCRPYYLQLQAGSLVLQLLASFPSMQNFPTRQETTHLLPIISL